MPVASFGTDGIRGVALVDVTTDLARSLGRAAASVLPGDRWLIGSDGRASGPALVDAFAEGVSPTEVIDLGVLPTPAVAFHSQRLGLPAAIVSASHNPWTDNGIKLLAPGGRKLTDALEAEIAARMDPAAPRKSRLSPWDVDDSYDQHLIRSVGSLGKMRVVVDCANGAASEIAPRVLRQVVGDVIAIGDRPDGTNINDGCGSTHPAALQAAVVDAGADVGLALDGDADRVLAVDHTGALVDGDHILAICAADLHARGQLAHDTVVVTVMSNLGLRTALTARGIHVVETAVGDRYVLDAMDTGSFSLGGEQSGHVIFGEVATTGDGLLTGLQLLDTVARDGRPLAEIATHAMTRLPQVLRNVRVVDRDGLAGATAVWAMVKEAEAELGAEGRVLLRPSGTEPLVRVMVEAPTVHQAESVAERIAAAVTQNLGQ